MGLSRCTEKNDFVISCELISEDHTLKSIHICSGFFYQGTVYRFELHSFLYNVGNQLTICINEMPVCK